LPPEKLIWRGLHLTSNSTLYFNTLARSKLDIIRSIKYLTRTQGLAISAFSLLGAQSWSSSSNYFIRTQGLAISRFSSFSRHFLSYLRGWKYLVTWLQEVFAISIWLRRNYIGAVALVVCLSAMGVDDRVSRFFRSILSSESLVNHLWTMVNLWILVYSVYLTLGWLSKIVNAFIVETAKYTEDEWWYIYTIMMSSYIFNFFSKAKALNATIQWRGDRPWLESHVGTKFFS